MNTKIIRRFAVLTILLACFGWFSAVDSGSRAVLASTCCTDCPGGGNGDGVIAHCQDKCGSRSGTCFDNCTAPAFICYAACTYCGGSQPCSSGQQGEEFCQFLGFTGCSNNYCY